MADPQEEKIENDNEGLKNKKTGGAVEEETVVEDPVVEDLFALLSKLKLKEKEEESGPTTFLLLLFFFCFASLFLEMKKYVYSFFFLQNPKQDLCQKQLSKRLLTF